MAERELAIGSAGAELPATLTLPAGSVRGGVVPLHPASDGSRHQFLFEHLTDTVVPRGIAVLRYDRRPSRDGRDIPFAVQWRTLKPRTARTSAARVRVSASGQTNTAIGCRRRW